MVAVGPVQQTGISLGRGASVMISLSDRSSSYNVDLAVNSEPRRVKQNVTFSLPNNSTPLGFILTAMLYQAEGELQRTQLTVNVLAPTSSALSSNDLFQQHSHHLPDSLFPNQ